MQKTYDRHNLFLDCLGEFDNFHVYRKVDLLRISFQVSEVVCQGRCTELRSIAMLMVCWARVILANCCFLASE